MGSEDGVEGCAAEEAPEDEGVVDFLDCGEDSCEGAEKVVEDLDNDHCFFQLTANSLILFFIRGEKRGEEREK